MLETIWSITSINTPAATMPPFPTRNQLRPSFFPSNRCSGRNLLSGGFHCERMIKTDDPMIVSLWSAHEHQRFRRASRRAIVVRYAHLAFDEILRE